ncbi:copper transport protein [Mesorhizobium shonense]|uniref:Copper transport protein n=1 Tax=Mesorhizobium shonense TaxID=1209948 RepID=A0ABV2HXJ6_9HYPH
MPAGALKKAAAAFIVAAILFTGGAPAFAHAQLIASDPPDGAVLPQPPETLTLKFSEPVSPLVARLSNSRGRTQALSDIGVKDKTIVVRLPAGLEQGTHLLSWRVTSSDGHPIGGGLLFSIGAPSASAPAAAGQTEPAIRTGIWIARFLIICGLVFGIGGAVFRSLVAGTATPAAMCFVSTALVAGLAGATVLIPFQGLDALGAPLNSAFSFDVWNAGLWAMSYGHATLAAAIALLIGLAAFQQSRKRTTGILGGLALLTAGLAFASAGHAASAPPKWLMIPAVFVHTVAVLLWLGALAPLGAAIACGGPDAVFALKRFSNFIPAIIGALFVSGIAIGVVQVHTPSALLTSNYGRVLLIKLGLVAAMLLLAAVNRYALTRPAIKGDVVAARRLSRSIAAEIILGIAVICVLGLWRFTPPPRVVAANPARFEVQQVSVANEDVSALLSIHPPIAGPVRVEVSEVTAAGKPLVPLGVIVELGKPSYGIGPFARQAKASDRGTYIAGGYLLPLDGFWVVRATILVSDFRSVTLTNVFDVRKATD